MELYPHVQDKLLKGHKLRSAVEASLVVNFLKNNRVLALVESIDKPVSGETTLHALFVYKAARQPVHSSIDLILEHVIPLDVNFKCEIESSPSSCAADFAMHVTSGKRNFLFDLYFGEQTNAFVSDILRAAEGLNKRRGGAPEFSWTLPYMNNLRGSTGDGLADTLSTTDSSVQGVHKGDADTTDGSLASGTCFYDGDYRGSDLPLDRQNIAMGVSPTPVAARESHIRHHMAKVVDSYTDIHNFTVFVGTWNVNGQYPSIGLSEWLSSDVEPPDLYAIGFQELDLTKEVFLFNVTTREQEWLNAVLNGVHPKAKYKKVHLVRLIGMMLVVLVQDRHLAYIRNVSADTVGTGIMNKLGNKGAVSVRLELHNTSMAFVSAHLAAHAEEVERRNEDHDCVFARTAYATNALGPPKSIRDHDHIYFLGDMNYRINPGNFDIRQLADKEQFKLLLDNDQLTQQKKLNRVFADFKEGPITFKPTYKYDLNSNNWDSSEKGRQPSWCDRILWKGEGIEQVVYRSHPSLQISDHKPVSSLFISGIKVIDNARFRKTYEEVMKKLDRLENEFLPQVTVDLTEVIFEPVTFLQEQTRSLTIANTGQVPVQFSFINKLNETSFCKPWLSIRPYASFIMPGDKCDIALRVLVDRRSASMLNIGADQLYDILVLHLEGGKDIFITVTGEYQRSCFGASINALVHVNKPFKELSVAELIDLESSSPKNQLDLPYAVPKELWFLVDRLTAAGMDQEGLFSTPGLHKEIIEIRNALDGGMPGDKLPGGVHSAAEALLLFLEALSESVIPARFCSRALEATPNFYLCKQVIDELPERHRNVFNYLMFFLKDLLQHSNRNGLDAKTLAHVFGIILLRSADAPKSSGDLSSINGSADRRKQTFVHHFLVNEYE